MFQITNAMVLTQRKEKTVVTLGYNETNVKTKKVVALITLCQMLHGASREVSHKPNERWNLTLLVRFLLEMKRARINNNNDKTNRERS